MRRATVISVLSICPVFIATGVVNAQESKPRVTLTRYTEDYINKVNAKAEGLGIGYEVGYWAPSFSFGIKSAVPIGKTWGMMFRVWMPQGYMQYRGPTNEDGELGTLRYDPCVNISVEYYKRSQVFMGLFRVYIGGYMHVGVRLRTWADDLSDQRPYNMKPMIDTKYRRFGLAGGGKVGVEFFIAPNKAYFIEVGGQGPGHALQVDTGAMVQTGAMWYFGGK